MLSQYNIEHTLWMYPDNYYVGNSKQPSIRGHDVQPHNPKLVLLSLEELCELEQKHNYTDHCVSETNNCLMSILWKVGEEGNPIKSSQTPLLLDVCLEMHCLQVIHHMLNKSNTYRIDDKEENIKFVDPDWEVTTPGLLHEMSEQYKIQGINIPESIIGKLSSFQMSLGRASHQNYAMIDNLISEATYRLCLPTVVAGGFPAW